MKDDRERLLDMREAIERVERYTASGQESFTLDSLLGEALSTGGEERDDA